MSTAKRLTQNRTYGQAMAAARQLLPKLKDDPAMEAKAQFLAECLLDYVRYLQDGNTTALDMGIDTRKLLLEMANEIGDIADSLAPNTPTVREILNEFNYYETLE